MYIQCVDTRKSKLVDAGVLGQWRLPVLTMHSSKLSVTALERNGGFVFRFRLTAVEAITGLVQGLRLYGREVNI
jgi:hypothetical protein